MEARSLLLLFYTATCLSTQQVQSGEIQGIRLANGTYGKHLGRVELLYNETWGTICDNWWSYSDGLVTCRMLGFRETLCVVSRGEFGRGQGPIWMDNPQCRGSEQSLEDCAFNGWGVHSCTHAKDVGVVCAADGVMEAPTNVEVVDSSTTTLTVQWNTPDIPPGLAGQRYRVTYKSEDSSFAHSRYMYPSHAQSSASRLNMTIRRLQRDTKYLIEVRLEAHPRLCFNYKYLYGNSSKPIFASTNATKRVSLLKVRLVPPHSGFDFLGRLEVLHNGVWGTVCDDGFGSTEANMVCGMLNYTRALCSVPYARLGQGRGQIWLDDVDCSVGHEVLEECNHRGWGVHNCQHSSDVGVVCSPNLGNVKNLRVTAVSSSSVTLRWDLFSFPSIAVNSLYRIRYHRPQDLYYRTVSVSPGTIQTTVGSLQFASSYSFSIRAEVRFSYCYLYVYGNYSDPVRTTTTESEPTGPPTAFHAVVLNSTAIEMQWNLPLSNLRNGIIRGYKLFVQRENQEEMTINIPENRTNEYILSRLDPGTAYIVSVLVYTVGDGPRSIHLTVITPLVSPNCIVAFGVNGDSLDKVTRYSYQRDLRVHCRAARPEAEVGWFYANRTKIGSMDRNFGKFTIRMVQWCCR